MTGTRTKSRSTVKIELPLDRANLMHQILLTGINAIAEGVTEIRETVAAGIAKAQGQKDNVTNIRKRKDAPKTS